MATELESWPRPHFEEGGGNPFLLYFVFGAFDPKSMSIRASEYRTNGVPDGVDVRILSNAGPEARTFTSGSFGTMLDEKPDLASAVRAAPQMLTFRGELGDFETLDYLRDAVGTLTALLEKGGVGIFDAMSFRWYSSDEFRATFFTPEAPVPNAHVSIFLSEEDGDTHWIHTRGMRKFGRPDVSIHGVKPALRGAMVELCNRFIEMLAFGAVVPEGHPIQMKGLPDGYRAFHGGDLDDPEFNNVHIAIRRDADAADDDDDDDDA